MNSGYDNFHLWLDGIIISIYTVENSDTMFLDYEKLSDEFIYQVELFRNSFKEGE